MLKIASIALGGAAGALLRYWTSTGVHAMLGRDFPYGTLVVNVAGSLLIGLSTALLADRLSLSPEWRAGIVIGLLGAFTTFSTFSIETLNLIEQREFLRAVANIVLSVLLCLAAAALGLLAGRQL